MNQGGAQGRGILERRHGPDERCLAGWARARWGCRQDETRDGRAVDNVLPCPYFMVNRVRDIEPLRPDARTPHYAVELARDGALVGRRQRNRRRDRDERHGQQARERAKRAEA